MTIDLPDRSRAFEYENSFIMSCDSSRMAKWMAHWELFNRVSAVPGAFFEFGVFKGNSFLRFAMFRSLLGRIHSLNMYGFDVFGEFPSSVLKDDVGDIEQFVSEAGSSSISRDDLVTLLCEKGEYKNIELIEGDICQTLPIFLEKHSSIRASMINLDVDIFEPSVLILELLWDRLSKGGVLLLDDYGKFAGETEAVNEFVRTRELSIECLPFCQFPSFIVKR